MKHQADPRQREESSAMRRQMTKLQLQLLPRIGYRNIFAADGYEADDVMAAIEVPKQDRIIYVTGDKDIFQLIGPRSAVWYTRDQVLWDCETFAAHYGIAPGHWPRVKALQGDAGDSIPGVKGVGPSSALAYYRGKDITGPYRKRIEESFDTDHYRLMLKLVELPFPECPEFRPTVLGEVCQESWNEVMKDLGVTTLPYYPGAKAPVRTEE
jgi:5'-3' exonuclease